MIFDLVLIVTIVCLIFLSGFPDEMDKAVNKRFPLRHIPEKPFRCSLCMSFWAQVIYLLVTQQFTLISLCIALGLAFGNEIIQNAIVLVKALVNRILTLLMNLIDR